MRPLAFGFDAFYLTIWFMNVAYHPNYAQIEARADI